MTGKDTGAFTCPPACERFRIQSLPHRLIFTLRALPS
jgi:hypothetical protein